jgi:hypothetical protein
LGCSTVSHHLAAILEQQAALANKLGKSKSSHHGSSLAQSPPTHHPAFFGSARRKLVELSPKTPLFSKDETRNAFNTQAFRATVSLTSSSSYLESLLPAQSDPRRLLPNRLAMAD